MAQDALTDTAIEADIVAPLAELTEVEDAPADTTTPYILSDGDVVFGTREGEGDDDWYAIELTAGDFVIVKHEGIGPDELTDPFVYLYDDTITSVAKDDYSGPGYDSQMEFLVSETGTYYINADAYRNSLTGDYQLTVEVQTTQSLTLGTTFVGNLGNEDDSDYYSVSVELDKTYIVTLRDSGTGDPIDGLYLQTYYRYDYAYEFGRVVSSQARDESGVSHAITARYVEDLAIVVSSRDGDIGDYELTVELDPLDGTDTTATLSVGETVEAGLEFFGDSDWFAVELSADEIYELRFGTGGFFDTIKDPRLLLFDAAGEKVKTREIAETDDSSLFILSELEAGTYYVAIDSAGSPSDYGSYTLSLDQGERGPDTSDTYVGTEESDVFLTSGGADSVTAGGGNDYADTGTGADSVLGEGGNDVLHSSYGNDTVSGGDGDDVIDGGGKADSLMGDGGADTIDGGSGSDIIDGGDGNDVIRADGGHDMIMGGANADVMRGNGGFDTLLGGSGDDSMRGDGKKDWLEGNNGNDMMDGGDQADTLLGGVGDDDLYGGLGLDSLDGGDGNDTLDGGKGSDTVTGGDGDDSIQANGGHDYVDGGDGNDMMNGKGGRDTLIGGAGDDSFFGGNDADLYVVGDGADVITEYEIGIDEIVFEEDFFAATFRSADDGLDGVYVDAGNLVIEGAGGDTVTILGVTSADDLTIL